MARAGDLDITRSVEPLPHQDRKVRINFVSENKSGIIYGGPGRGPHIDSSALQHLLIMQIYIVTHLRINACVYVRLYGAL